MSDTKYNALVLGASGLIGKETLNLLLKNNKYKIIYAVTRKSLGISNHKLYEVIADINTIETALKDIQVDHLFSCIGTTATKTPDKNQYYGIDLHYPLKVATLLQQQGCQTLCLISSMGADSSSKNFYLRLKGDVEEVMKNLNFSTLHVFRPSLLLGKRPEFRLFEKIAQFLSPLFNKILPSKYSDYKSIQAKDVASAMINVALKNTTGLHIYQTQQIKEIA